MSNPWFFGYGSLVNLATHDYRDPRPATLTGWRRVWRHTSLRPAAFLSVEPADTVIDGIVARVPGGDWTALDAREAAYIRRDVGHQVTPKPSVTVAVYQVSEGLLAPPTTAHPIWLSYLDAVIQGFHAIFGEPGVARFFETTAGWDGPILNDRADPHYPRHQRLSVTERSLVDSHLCRLGITPEKV